VLGKQKQNGITPCEVMPSTNTRAPAGKRGQDYITVK
jgi:hypothetical protein